MLGFVKPNFEAPMTPTTEILPRTAVPDRLLRMRDLIELTALSRATIYREMEAGNFPLPIRIGGNNRWLLADIINFIEARKAARGRSA
jgi:prophage regulatory protein